MPESSSFSIRYCQVANLDATTSLSEVRVTLTPSVVQGAEVAQFAAGLFEPLTETVLCTSDAADSKRGLTKAVGSLIVLNFFSNCVVCPLDDVCSKSVTYQEFLK